MTRQARKRSSIGIYHVMLKGIDKRDISYMKKIENAIKQDR